MNPTELAVGGVAVAPLIMALVQAAREAGLPGRMAPIAAMLLGIMFGVAAYASVAGGAAAQFYTDVILGLSSGIIASGIYSAAKAFTGTTPSASTPTTPTTTPESTPEVPSPTTSPVGN